MKRFVVVGLGNPLMGDDGVGLRALQQLERDWAVDSSVEMVDGGTWGLKLLPAIEGADGVVFLDAIRTGSAPGTIVELRNAEIPRLISKKLSPHEVDLREVLAVMELCGVLPPSVCAIGVEPEYVDLQYELSPTVSARVHDMVALAVDRLREWGVRCIPASHAADACTR